MTNNPQLVLGLDLDGVVFNYEAAARARFSRLLGLDPAGFGPATNWSFVKSGWPLRDELHFSELHLAAVADGMFEDMPTIDGASETLWRLSDAGVYIRVVTHRLLVKGGHAAAAMTTVVGLERNRIPYSDLTFVKNKPSVGADVYLDDAPHNIVALRDAGNYAIVFDQPYNRDLPGPRARNWDEAYELIGAHAIERGFQWEPQTAEALASVA